MVKKMAAKTIRIDEHAWEILIEAKRALKEQAKKEGKKINPTLSDAIRYLASLD